MKTLLLAAFVMGSRDQVELRVTFYDGAPLHESSRSAMFAVAERVLRVAGIHVVWVEATPGDATAKLISYPEPPRKGSVNAAACRARADVALELLGKAPEGLRGTVLGVAHPFATEGLNVRLFIDRIEVTALRERQSASVLGGHVLAHEIAHVFLRSNDHSTSGLMAPVWADHEYARMKSGTLLLSKGQAAKIRLSLSRVGCSIPDC